MGGGITFLHITIWTQSSLLTSVRKKSPVFVELEPGCKARTHFMRQFIPKNLASCRFFETRIISSENLYIFLYCIISNSHKMRPNCTLTVSRCIQTYIRRKMFLYSHSNFREMFRWLEAHFRKAPTQNLNWLARTVQGCSWISKWR